MSSHEPSQEEWHVMARHAAKENNSGKSMESGGRLVEKYDEDEHRNERGTPASGDAK